MELEERPDEGGRLSAIKDRKIRERRKSLTKESARRKDDGGRTGMGQLGQNRRGFCNDKRGNTDQADQT